MNKQFELLKFVFEFTAGSVCLCGVCCPVVVFGLSVRLLWVRLLWVRLLWVVMEDCDACTVCVVCVFDARLLGCEGDGNAGVGSGGGVGAVSAYMGCICGSGVLASAGGVLEMSVVRGVGGVYDLCMCLAWGGVGGVGGERVIGLGLGFTNSGGTWRKCDMCFGCGVVGREWMGGLGQGLGGWGGVMSVL